LRRALARAGAVRILAGAALVAAILLVLWQTGLLSERSSSDTGPVKEPANLRAADTALQTPNTFGLSVGLKPGNVAPDFEFSDYSGRRYRLSDFRGHAVVLNFWASWCAPCKQELPAMSAVLRLYEGRLSVIAVNNGESYQTGRRFLDQVKADLTSFAYDPAGVVARKYAIDGMPTSFFIDADGVVTRVTQGPLTQGTMKSGVEEAIIGYGRVQARPARP
jgi:thiol-disulfide isomerase/thioredoxin